MTKINIGRRRILTSAVTRRAIGVLIVIIAVAAAPAQDLPLREHDVTIEKDVSLRVAECGNGQPVVFIYH